MSLLLLSIIWRVNVSIICCFTCIPNSSGFRFHTVESKHLDLKLGNLDRQHLAGDMIGREKVNVKDYWFPREFEGINDNEELLMLVYEPF